jgi:hypothetical protein
MKRVAISLVAGCGLTGCAYFTPPLEHPSFEQHAQGRINTFGVIPSRRMMIVKSGDPLVQSGDPEEQKEKRILICAEAPADVTDNLASTFAASLAASGKGVDVGGSLTKTIETFGRALFKRSQGIQLFRDRSYYLCQARMNGFITDEEYKTSLNEAFEKVIPLIEKELSQVQAFQPASEADQSRVKVPETKAEAGRAKTSISEGKVESRVEGRTAEGQQ